MTANTLKSRAQKEAERFLERGLPTGPLINNADLLAEALTAFAAAERERALGEAIAEFTRHRDTLDEGAKAHQDAGSHTLASSSEMRAHIYHRAAEFLRTLKGDSGQ